MPASNPLQAASASAAGRFPRGVLAVHRNALSAQLGQHCEVLREDWRPSCFALQGSDRSISVRFRGRRDGGDGRNRVDAGNGDRHIEFPVNERSNDKNGLLDRVFMR